VICEIAPAETMDLEEAERLLNGPGWLPELIALCVLCDHLDFEHGRQGLVPGRKLREGDLVGGVND
jgi:hypothetical protein